MNIEHDRHVAEPTLFLQGILVTTDDRLKERLKEWSAQKRHDLKMMSPAEAVEYLTKLNAAP